MILKSYASVWKVETKIYAIGNIRLPLPVSPVDTGYFLLVLGVVLILGLLVPLFALVPAVPRLLILPYLGMVFLRRKKLDGKNPLRFAASYLRYLPRKGKQFELFQNTAPKKPAAKQKIIWTCGARNTSMY